MPQRSLKEREKNLHKLRRKGLCCILASMFRPFVDRPYLDINLHLNLK